jgi:hypothetical protein
MTQSKIGRLALVVVLVALTPACQSHPVSETPALQGETMQKAQQSILSGDKLSPTTEQVLNVLDLVDIWERDPRSTPDRIAAIPGGRPDWVKRVARAELFYALARNAADPREAQALYLEAVLTAAWAIRDQANLTAAFDPRHHLLAAIYNRGLARFLVLGQENDGHREQEATEKGRKHGEQDKHPLRDEQRWGTKGS